jgi:transcriptional regulator with XRE-family HTH domain
MTSQATGDEQDPPAEQPRPAAPLEPALNPLQRLIQQRLRERGWSYREVARRGGLPHSTVHTLAATRNLARPPRPATIDALAKGLDVPVSAVRAAAAASTGLHYYDEAPGEPENPGDPERELLIASIDELTPEERRHVAALVESLRNRAEREPGGSLAPIFAAGSRPLAGLNGVLLGAAQVAAVQALCAECLPLVTRYWGR